MDMKPCKKDPESIDKHLVKLGKIRDQFSGGGNILVRTDSSAKVGQHVTSVFVASELGSVTKESSIAGHATSTD